MTDKPIISGLRVVFMEHQAAIIREAVANSAALLWGVGASQRLLIDLDGFRLDRMAKDLGLDVEPTSLDETVQAAALRMEPACSGYLDRDSQLLAYARQANPNYPLPPRRLTVDVAAGYLARCVMVEPCKPDPVKGLIYAARWLLARLDSPAHDQLERDARLEAIERLRKALKDL